MLSHTKPRTVFSQCHQAIQAGNHIELTQHLAADKAVIYCRDTNRNTLLHLAVQANRIASIQLLLDYDADPNTLNDLEETPLMVALLNDHCDLATIILLLERGADPNLTNQAKESPLYHALIYSHLQQNTHRLTTLLQYTVDVNAICGHFMRPLECAIYFDDPLLVYTLLQQGADINQRNVQGKTLFLAGISQHLQHKSIIDYLLLKKRALLYEEDTVSIESTFRTLLDDAILCNHHDLVISLLPYVNINRYNTEGYTPLLFALNCTTTNPKIIDTLLNHHPKLNGTDPQGNTALHLAITHHTPNIAGAILMQGANPNTTNGKQWTPLFTALKQTRRPLEKEQYIRLLLTWGADLNLNNYLDPSKILLKTIKQQIVEAEKTIKTYNPYQSTQLTRLLLAEPCIKTWLMERKNARPLPKEVHDCILTHLVPRAYIKALQQWPIHFHPHMFSTPISTPRLG